MSQLRIVFPKISIKPVILAFGFVYIGFHVMHGERGLYAWFKQTRFRESLRAELHQIKTEREALELRVTQLRDSSIDTDLLDEQTRRMLGNVGEGEQIILLNPQQD